MKGKWPDSNRCQPECRNGHPSVLGKLTDQVRSNNNIDHRRPRIEEFRKIRRGRIVWLAKSGSCVHWAPIACSVMHMCVVHHLHHNAGGGAGRDGAREVKCNLQIIMKDEWWRMKAQQKLCSVLSMNEEQTKQWRQNRVPAKDRFWVSSNGSLRIAF